MVSLIDERDVIEKMLKCLGLWQQGVRVDSQLQTGTDPPLWDWVYEPIDQDPYPDYDTKPVFFYANACAIARGELCLLSCRKALSPSTLRVLGAPGTRRVEGKQL